MNNGCKWGKKGIDHHHLSRAETKEFSISLSPPAPRRKLVCYTIGMRLCKIGMQPCPFSPTPWARYGWLAQSFGGQFLGEPCFGSSFCWGPTFWPKHMSHFTASAGPDVPSMSFLTLPCDSREYQLTQNLKGKKKKITCCKQILLMVRLCGPENVKKNLNGFLPASSV